MSTVQFLDSSDVYFSNVTKISNNVVQLTNVPENTNGFYVLGKHKNDYSQYTTIHKKGKNYVQFSNDGSIAKKTIIISILWDDGNDQKGNRPERLSIPLSDGSIVELSDENNWSDNVEILYFDELAVEEFHIPNYSISVSNNIITAVTDYEKQVEPTADERIDALENSLLKTTNEITQAELAVAEIYEMIIDFV